MEFLVRQMSRYPRTPEAAGLREQLRTSERARATELREAGVLIRLWRVPGTQDSLGLYRCESATELHDVLASLPMFPWLEIEIQPLATHPQEA
jgi:muconolactone D-isomerase